ncbi:MAG: anhydro-N-acetylmuramic acid kinase [Nitrospira sp.]|nr:anhydro-N-acetylmuramic acid kinase [Nitrospira sp.]
MKSENKRHTAKPLAEALVIGIMSGTSHDGADLVLANIKGDVNSAHEPHIKAQIIAAHYTPFRTALRNQIREAFSGSAELICRLNFSLGEIYAAAVTELLEKAGMTSHEISAVASHGQTIYHIPPAGKRPGSTLQIGEADVIAQRTGIMTIADFRTRDMAAGGHGAPLVPMADHLLFGKQGQRRTLLNIGGISNVTIVTGLAADTLAYDIGPGNCMIDEAVRYFTGGKKTYDRNGALARSGNVDSSFLKALLVHPFLKKRPPKSTGREVFGESYTKSILAKHPGLTQEDAAATLTEFSAEVIARSIRVHEVDEVIVSGGGAKNIFMMERLIQKLQGNETVVNLSSVYGIPEDSKEALCFAVLGYLSLNRLHGNVPVATGATHSVVLGKISLP